MGKLTQQIMSVLREIAVFLCGFLMFRVCMGQVLLIGQCPKIQAMQQFDASRYLGKWYEAEAYFFLFEFGGKCVTATYDKRENNTIGVLNKQINVFTGLENQIQGVAVLAGRSDEAKLLVSFPSLPVNVAAPYWVVDTDYDNYAVVFSCFQLGGVHSRNAWLLTRQRNPPAEILKKAKTVAEKHGINRGYFIETNQKDCPDDNIPQNVV